MPNDMPLITRENLKEALSDRYLSYAVSVIMSRALPDARDGLKPVHRRVIYAMNELRLDHRSAFKKSARIVGDTMGKFHPHGDLSIYEALVRLAQDFSSRYPLVDGQGNFGNIDGDTAAAMRYTESRMTVAAEAMLAGINENAIDFRPTYDNAEEEPVVLPSAFPNLLANGAQGIAVGMATSIPPHNVGEICDAAIALIHDPSIDTAGLLEHIKGPDYPTGGEMVETPEAILTAYETGRGAIKTRARWHKEEGKHGLWHIVVTEIPYQVQKSKLIEAVAELLNEKRLPLLEDIRDESAEHIRIVLVPRNRTVDPDLLMASLFKLTDLQTNFNFNLNVLNSRGVPGVLGLKSLLQEWLDHQFQVLVRRSQFRIDAIDRRLEILGGYLKVFLNLDEVIRIIREDDEPKNKLIETFSLSDIQAEAILNMRLRSLRRLEEMDIRTEHQNLTGEVANLREMISEDLNVWAQVTADVAKIKKTFGDTPDGGRRTVVGKPAERLAVEAVAEATIEKEPVTVILSAKGWIRAIKGHNATDADLKFKDGDYLGYLVKCQSTDKVAIISKNGRVYTVKVSDLPRGRGDGQVLRIMVEIPTEDEILDVFVPDSTVKYFVASNVGYGFICPGEELTANKKAGKTIMTLSEGQTWDYCLPLSGDHVAVVGSNGKLLIFPLDQMTEYVKGKGIVLQKYKEGEKISDLKLITLSDGLSWKVGDTVKAEKDLTIWTKGRGSQGPLAPKGFPKNNRFGA